MICKNVLGLSESERALEEHTQIHTTGKRVPGTEYRVLRYPHPKVLFYMCFNVAGACILTLLLWKVTSRE